MNNEPVAYINKDDGLVCAKCFNPLYTHPAKTQGTREMRKVSIRTVENTIGLARSVANGTTKFPFMGYCADLMEKMLEEIKEARSKQTKRSSKC